jgi:exopolysaccharide biosynthesis polyprenyl glycosylphosphotransferase
MSSEDTAHDSVGVTTIPEDKRLKMTIPEAATDSNIFRSNDFSVAETASLSGKRYMYIVKRVFDLVVSFLVLAVFSPIYLIVAAAIKLDSEGPVVFKQKRIGKNEKPFIFYKFRSMHVDNDNSLHREYVTRLIQGDKADDLRSENGSFKIAKDPRVTRVGYFLRSLSLDELPQIINVIKGDMSLVGPRPPLEYEVSLYSAHHKRRLEVLPGLTGWWQVNGRTEKNFEEMVNLDLFYIDNWSLGLDLKILLLTVPAVLSRKGAC